MRFAPIALAAALAACAEPALARADSVARSGPYTLEVLDGSGAALPTFRHRGRTYVLGTLGERYQVRVRNLSARRVEAVVSVDGRDVVDGRPARIEKRGYVVAPYGEVVVDGFRLSGAAVAAFRFSAVRDAYAARMGDARDVGVIGVAVFPERAPRPPPLASRGRGGAEAEAPAPHAAPGAPSDAAGAAPAPELRAEQRAEKAPRDRPGLGTAFGEERESHVTEVAFERASPSPAAVLSVRYDDRDGLLALGIDVDGRRAWRDDAWLRDHADPFRRSGYAEPPPGWR